jgi:hypothetical protein
LILLDRKTPFVAISIKEYTNVKTSIFSALATALLLSVAVGYVFADDGGKGPNNGNNTQIRLRTNLAGAAIGGKKPGGNADFRMDNGRTRLNVEVENVNLPAGTVLTVAVTHAGATTTAGTITLNSSGEIELELDSQHGDTVPTIASGDMITVSNGAAVILAGAF